MPVEKKIFCGKNTVYRNYTEIYRKSRFEKAD